MATLSRRAVDTLDSRLWHHLAMGVHPASAIAAYKDGELVLDLYGGSINSGDGSKVASDTLYSVWSCGKPMAAACLWVLKERGKVDWDDLVGDIWDGYGVNGKESTTVRHVLTHEAGVPTTPRGINEANWDSVVTAMESAEAEFEPGSAIEYHSSTFGFLVRELVQRISGQDFEDFFQAEVAGPLGLVDTTYRLDAERMPRLARLMSMPNFGSPDLAEKGNSEEYKFHPSPGGNGTSTARDLARFYSVLSNGGSVDGTQWLSAETVADVTSIHAEGLERASGNQHRRGLGVQVANDGPGRMGDAGGSHVFGHGGVGTCISWGDSKLKAGAAVVTSGLQPNEVNDERLQTFSQLVRDALES
ncbi:MAG: beta-lactamase family protein [Chloroflexi bacterium]|nr:beta-lactamase family protein [Chloroflexota bacterium]MBT4073230.1 beta-lactamase family protein [Chloroflexota bacterium]MBT4514407.1 beta-lactamase family protein [Chloroflexota bacterium]MBT5320395.1 beta-lactamase family protein [Chloroflexota bacterium]MBT6681827.1 beta-lactamase family protein [Chloroflexota bacterium]